MKKVKIILVILSVFLSAGIADAQSSGDENINDSKREEIQRYFGYETLLLRYYTAPYDVTMNINERGNFLDIGYLYLLFLPVLLLICYRREKWFVILSILSLILLFIVSTSNSFVYDARNISLVENRDGKLLSDLEIDFAADPVGAITLGIYHFNNLVYQPINSVIKSISGQRDYVTYPILLSLFIFYSYFLLKRFDRKYSKPKYMIIFIVWFYSFLWFLLSAGIVWYGYLMLLLALVLIVLVIKDLDFKDGFNKFIKNSFYGLATLWLIIGFINRVSNINPATPTEHQGKGLYNPSFYSYSAGYINVDGAIESLYPNLSLAVKRINKYEDKLVYRIGTSFTYFIENNSERVMIDNQLGLFNQLVQKFPEKRSLAKAMKASDFKFIIIDLYTPTIDRTPERTLTKKFNLFMNFIYQNEELKLIGTDRVIKSTKPNVDREFGVFGDIIANGSYAIYEIKN